MISDCVSDFRLNMKSLSQQYKNISATRGAQFVPIEIQMYQYYNLAIQGIPKTYIYISKYIKLLSLKSDTQSDIIEAFNNISRYLDYIFNIDNPFFDTLFPFIYPKMLRLNKTNESNLTASFLDLDLSINNGIISSKIYDNGTILISLIIHIWIEMFLVLHLTGFTFYNLSVLLRPVPLLNISIFVIEHSQKTS